MMEQLAFNFFAKPPAPPRRKPLTAKQQRAADLAAEKARQEARWAEDRERKRLEARAYWKVGMVASMPLFAKYSDGGQAYSYCMPGVVEAIEGDTAQVRIYAAPEYGCWMENYPLHRKLAVDVPLAELGRYALNEHLVKIAAEGNLEHGDADVAKEVRERYATVMKPKKTKTKD